MKKIIMFNRISLDGFFAGPHGETHEWFVHDPGVDKTSHTWMKPDTVLMGRVTYELFESFWPPIAADPKQPKAMRKISDELNTMKKIVFSTTLQEATWENTELIHGGLPEEVKKLKQKGGGDIVIFGSGSLVQQLTDEGLIDEYLFCITPAIIGKGKSMFNAVKKSDLKLTKSKILDSGNVMLLFTKADKKQAASKSKATKTGKDRAAKKRSSGTNRSGKGKQLAT